MNNVPDEEQVGDNQTEEAAETHAGGDQSISKSTNNKYENVDIVADNNTLAGLSELEGWSVDTYAARVHYQGESDRYSIEFYAPSNCVLYWKVKGDGETAVPVGRMTVPDPLRTRIRSDLADAGIDPAVEDRTL